MSSPTMHGDELRFVREAFETNWVAPLGKNVDEFERETARFVGVAHAAAVVSGTAALHLAVKLAGIGEGDVVLCSDLTFAATVNPVSYERGVQVFVDSERDTWNMDPNALKTALEKYDGSAPDRPKARAVILAHLYGTPAKLDEITALCGEHGVTLIEDAAESLSATYKGRQTGTFGRYSVLSFNGNKIITTSGGGMLLSEDEAAVRKARFWATQAREKRAWYEHEEIGYNYRMSNVVAGIGRGQLLWLLDHRARKQAVYERYRELLAGLPLTLNPYLPDTLPNFWLTCALIDRGVPVSPEDVRLKLEEHNVESRPLWKPMHLQPVYRARDFVTAQGEDVAGDLFSRGLCLPSDVKMTAEDQRRVAGIIKSCF
ncbi:MAG TPA: aminotransferase class I/II-fold pyridoxal phosphate-dependent enzyme [Candidatus Limnocylindria bacterium]|nr:aminotransferase class I/II-fold pyridoxal phosphate-dependent enzyme [Candidatus Limnocylindria bacterium]